MSRQNVKHTALPADDVDELVQADALRHRPLSLHRRQSAHQCSECDDSGTHSHSRDSVEADGDADAADGRRDSQRAVKQPRKRKAKQSANAFNFQQIHTLNFLPPPPRDTPPLGNEPALLASGTLARQSNSSSMWSGSVHANTSQNAAFLPFATASLLHGTGDNNTYYFSSASKLPF